MADQGADSTWVRRKLMQIITVDFVEDLKDGETQIIMDPKGSGVDEPERRCSQSIGCAASAPGRCSP